MNDLRSNDGYGPGLK